MLAGLLDRLGCGRTLRDCCTSGSRSGLGEGRRRASYLQSRTGRLRKWRVQAQVMGRQGGSPHRNNTADQERVMGPVALLPHL